MGGIEDVIKLYWSLIVKGHTRREEEKGGGFSPGPGGHNRNQAGCIINSCGKLSIFFFYRPTDRQTNRQK